MKKAAQISIFALVILLIIAIYQNITRKSTDTTPTPSPIENKSPKVKQQELEGTSSDGTIKLTIKSEENPNGNVKHTFNVTNELTKSTQTIYEITEDKGVTYTIPDNRWSPDNKQFFIIRNDLNNINYLVFKADGANYKNNQKYLDVNDFWSKTKYTLKIKTITGWAGNDLPILYTTKEDGSSGPSFWFVTSTQSFLQLNS